VAAAINKVLVEAAVTQVGDLASDVIGLLSIALRMTNDLGRP
jgi:hypothetical protein